MKWKFWEPTYPTPRVRPSLPVPAPLPPIAPPTQDALDVTQFALSANGLAFIQRNESLRLTAYMDSAGIPTIGYGSTVVDGVKVKMGDTITPDRASAALNTDAKKFVLALRGLVNVPLTQNQVDSLVDFMYNVGSGAFQSSTLLKTIRSKAPVTADLFTRWNKVHDPKTQELVVVPGLTARREREFALYNS